MIYNEIKQDLFKVNDDYSLVHCISLDVQMGKGIATIFRNRYPDMVVYLKKYVRDNNINYPTCVWYHDEKENRKIFNLITKPKYWNKPNYFTITTSLSDMKKQCLELGITKIAMPLIGCGLDKLKWGKVRKIIIDTFNDTDIEILVCIK